ncbi:MAG: signal peptidase I [Anaerovoracaceae bacterium]
MSSWKSKNRPYIYAVVAALLLTMFFFPEVCEDNSMENNIPKAAITVSTKADYSAKRGEPKLGQVIVLEKPISQKIAKDNIFARVVGLPGDTIEIKAEKLYRNGEEYITKGTTDTITQEQKFKIDENSVFLLCDNRDVVLDSRNHKLGAVDMKEIRGNVKLILWPFSSFGLVKNN